jgi:hypothetical protein
MPPLPDIGQMRAELTDSVRSTLAAELRGQLRAEWVAELKKATAEMSAASAQARQQLANDFGRWLAQARQEDKQATLALFLSLRSDLENLASLTDDEMRLAQQGLARLAVSQSVTPFRK